MSRPPAPAVHGAVGPRRVPDWVVAASHVPGPDYADCFTIETTTTSSAREWAIALFGAEVLPGERFIWATLLGLRIAPGRSEDTIAGWRVVREEPDLVSLAAESSGLAANLLLRVDASQVSLATTMGYRTRLRGLEWGLLSRVHRAMAPGLLRRGARQTSSSARSSLIQS